MAPSPASGPADVRGTVKPGHRAARHRDPGALSQAGGDRARDRTARGQLRQRWGRRGRRKRWHRPKWGDRRTRRGDRERPGGCERAPLRAPPSGADPALSAGRERQGLLVRDAEESYLALEPQGEDALAPVLGSSITSASRCGPSREHRQGWGSDGACRVGGPRKDASHGPGWAGGPCAGGGQRGRRSPSESAAPPGVRAAGH